MSNAGDADRLRDARERAVKAKDLIAEAGRLLDRADALMESSEQILLSEAAQPSPDPPPVRAACTES
jgi:hypothetical protein